MQVWQSFSEHLTAKLDDNEEGKNESSEPSGFTDSIFGALGSVDDVNDELTPPPAIPRPPYDGPKGIQTYDEKTGSFTIV